MALARTHVVPNGVERFFGDDEIIVSKTDVQGKITIGQDATIAGRRGLAVASGG